MITNLLLLAFGVFVYMNLWYLYALKTKTLSVVDIAYSSSFVVISIATILFNPSHTITNYLLCALIAIWGLRLTIHLSKRLVQIKEDLRYERLKSKWRTGFAKKAYINIFMLQALLIFVIAQPLAIGTTVKNASLDWLPVAGLFVWIFGFIFESIADHQLASFNKTKKEHQILTKGLWKYSRHPNYFGEILQWWAIWIIVAGLPYGLYAIVSPITVTLLIIFVSGIPLIENSFLSNLQYQKYAKITSKLIPLPPKR